MAPNTMELFLFLQNKLNIRKAGVKLGDITRDELVPDHALALSTIKNHELPGVEVNLDQAIAYLGRNDFDAANAPKGWLMIEYGGLSLGWIKSLGNRINNYYPKEWRIRSQQAPK
jgi:NOL1/NOP2/fmu family ribosome biogenesis protein